MPRRAAALTVSGLSAAAMLAAALALRADRSGAIVLWGAAAWSTATFPLLAWSAAGARTQVVSDRSGSFTTVVAVGAEPADVARTSILASAAAGPTLAVTTNDEIADALDELGVPILVAPSATEGVHAAAAIVETDAVLILGAGAFLDPAAVAAAAGLLDADVAWVTGRTEPFNRDGYGPTTRDHLDQRLRESARAHGVDVWEPNATVVRTAVLRGAVVTPGRPWGGWLRDSRAAGLRGTAVTTTLAVWSVPVSPDWYWPWSVLKQRGAVADLADAAAASSGRRRWMALSLVARALYGYPFSVWVLCPLVLSWTDGFSLDGASASLAAVLAASAIARWSTLRWLHGVPLRPLRDLLAAAYDAPGSLLALPALSRHVRPTRLRLPRRPLVWITVLLMLALVVSLVRDHAAPDRARIVALALAELVLVWLFVMHGLLQLGWRRAAYRLPLTLAADVDGHPAASVIARPSALVMRGRLPLLPIGSDTTVAIGLGDGTVLTLPAVVSTARRDGDRGTRLTLSVADARWPAQLARAAVTTRASTLHVTKRTAVRRPSLARVRRVIGGAVSVAVGALALVAATLLVLFFFGLHPMVVRSGSMRPALGVGDVVLVRQVPAVELEVSDIATFDVDDDGGTTHRVVATSSAGDMVRVDTRGDANDVGEAWVVDADGDVGRVVASVPRLGIPAVWLGSDPVRPIVLSAALALAVALIMRGLLSSLLARRRRRPPTPRSVVDGGEPSSSRRAHAGGAPVHLRSSVSTSERAPGDSHRSTAPH